MGLSFRKSFKISKNTRINLSKNGKIGISTGVKGARISVNAQGIRGQVNKGGFTYRKQKSWNSAVAKPIEYTKEQLLSDDKLLQKHNGKITNKAVMKLIKKSLIWFFILAIIDATIFKSTILLWIIAIGVNLVCWTTMFSLIKKWWKANKNKELLN